MLFLGVGFFVRPSIDPFDVSLGLYIIQSMFVVISPAAFLAFNYLLYGRMILAVDQDFGRSTLDVQELESQPLNTAQKLTMLHKAGGPKREKVAFLVHPSPHRRRVFVWSDVITFIVQVGLAACRLPAARAMQRWRSSETTSSWQV